MHLFSALPLELSTVGRNCDHQQQDEGAESPRERSWQHCSRLQASVLRLGAAWVYQVNGGSCQTHSACASMIHILLLLRIQAAAVSLVHAGFRLHQLRVHGASSQHPSED